MANSERLHKNRNGQMLIPMNVEGSSWDDGFFSTNKFIALVIDVLITGGIILWTTTLYGGIVLKIVIYLGLAALNVWFIRFIVLEEKYYYKMYLKMKEYEISTPGIFWGISTMRDTEDGALLTYTDLKLAVLIRLERDTITGKEAEFRETHYDALSDFYREINNKNLKFIQMNIMEQAGKDPRLQKLDELVLKAENPNIADIIESQLGYIKRITRATLFESDYFLIYTDELNRRDTLISDTIDCIYKVLDGAFIGFSILNSKEIIELMKEEYGVKYFDYTEATVRMFKNSGINIGNTYSINRVNFKYSDSVDIGNLENNRLTQLTSYVKKGVLRTGEWSIKDALNGVMKKGSEVNARFNKKNGQVTFEDIAAKEEEDRDRIETNTDIESEIFGEYEQFMVESDDLDSVGQLGVSHIKYEKKENEGRKKGILPTRQSKKKDRSNTNNNQQSESEIDILDDESMRDNETVDF